MKTLYPYTLKRYFCEKDSHNLYTKSNEKIFLLFLPLMHNLWEGLLFAGRGSLFFRWAGQASLTIPVTRVSDMIVGAVNLITNSLLPPAKQYVFD